MKSRSPFQTVFLASIVAGTLATIAQLILWWLTDIPLPETLYRDTRLTAAILMGEDIIAPAVLMSAPSFGVLAIAGTIHFLLSLIYAAIFAVLQQYFLAAKSARYGLVIGAALGFAIYFVNMHGFTFFFPWFDMVRDWITIAAHIVFGLTLALVFGRR